MKTTLPHTYALSDRIRRRMGLWMIVGALSTCPAFAQNFIRHTQDVHLGSVSSTNGVAVADYDRDGDLDVYFVVWASYDPADPTTWNRLFANQGDGTFSLVTTTPALAGDDAGRIATSSMGYKMGASWGDYDNDGWPDLFLTNLGPNQLFHNNGDGTFTDVTAEAGVAGGATQLSSSALWFDYDRDGDLDLYVSNWEDYNGGDTYSKQNWLYENRGDGTFEDVTGTSGLDDDHATWTTVALDANHDGWLDLYLATDFGPNKFYLNNGDKTFQEQTAAFGLENQYHGMGLAIDDCDGNGYFDIYLTNITESGNDQEINPLFLDTGADYFTDTSVDAGVSLAGWGWGTEFLDLENDGDEDLFVATGYYLSDYANVLFRNRSETGDWGFENIAADVGVADMAPARGVAVFDYDEDGDPDVLVSNVTQSPVLYENTLPHGNWLDVKLEGTLSNRDGFGAVVEVRANGTTYKKYHHGAQYLAQNILPVHFGLRDAQAVAQITVTWPSGHVDTITDAVPANQTVYIKENVGLATSTEERPTTPDRISLSGTYPNPFNAATQIHFNVAAPGHVDVIIFNALGQTVRTIEKSFSAAGEQTVTWNATDQSGNLLRSGLYFYKIIANDGATGVATGTMLYIK